MIRPELGIMDMGMCRRRTYLRTHLEDVETRVADGPLRVLHR